MEPARIVALTVLMALGLTACGKPAPQAPNRLASSAKPAAPTQAAPEPPTPMPQTLSARDQDDLIEAVAGSELFARVLRNKDETGRVIAPGKEKSVLRAERDLVAIKARLADLSRTGQPTYLLLHSISKGDFLKTWLIGPDGGMVSGYYDRAYPGLGTMAQDLGVLRLSASRAPRPKGQPPVTPDAERAAQVADAAAPSVQKRGDALAWARSALMPGAVADALGTRSGRLLVVAARDTGTAPYAAFPLRNGVAAKNWSFVVLPDIGTLASGDAGFDYRALDIRKAVIVGDPNLSNDKSFDWPPLPGARAEASAVARRLSDPSTVLLLGDDATRTNFVKAINANPDAGIVYMATHAMADPKNPLTRGFVALTDGHYYAGFIRQERFKGWTTHHPLVIMSACQTALGRFLDGGGFGVARTWTVAGAGQVVASLWNVSDRATYLMMNRFVARLKAGDTPEIALQRAQLFTMNLRDPSGQHPYLNDPKMWASFTIYGKPTGAPAAAVPVSANR